MIGFLNTKTLTTRFAGRQKSQFSAQRDWLKKMFRAKWNSMRIIR